MPTFTFVREVAAPPEVVFDVLTDHRRYPEFTPIRRVEMDRGGEPEPNGVGAIRVVHSIGPPLHEEVIAYRPSSRFSYRLISGAPVRDYVATVSLEALGAGARITYAVRAIPTPPIGGAAILAAARFGVGQLLNGIIAESERRAQP
jgi:uncharacterized protein YndB with AHSA1/START domain